MTMAERRISRLEEKLQRELSSKKGKKNFYKIGYIQFELSQLYRLKGNKEKSDEKLKEALLSVSNPECKKGKRAERLSRLITSYINNPSAPPMVPLPAIYRYLSPLILLAGYASSYVAYFTKMIPYTVFLGVVFAVFVLSIVITSFTSSYYVRRLREDYTPAQPEVEAAGAENLGLEEKTPDDLVDDARAELSLANLYLSTKDFKEMELHLERARAFLNNPLTNQSKKKEQALGILNKLESSVRGKKLGNHYGVY